MAKFVPDAAMDAELDYIGASNIQHVCSAQPANYAGIAAVSLGSISMTPVTDFTKATGDVSGRKVTVAAKTSVPIATTGTITHLVLALTTDSTLRFVTTCTSAPVVSGGAVNIPAYKHEIQASS